MSAGKPSLLIHGNCQADHLARIARHLPDLREVFTIKSIETQRVTPEDWDTRYDEAFFADVRVVWNQAETGEPNEHRRMLASRLPAGCRIVNFPPLILLCLWPFSGSDPRVATAGDYVYPWPDSVAASLDPAVTGEDLPDDALYDRYMAMTRERMPDLDRRLRLDATRARAVEALSDFGVWDWIEAHFRTAKLFHTATHLTAPAFGYLMHHLLARTDGLTAAAIARAQRDAAFLMRGNDGQDVETVPIHPLIAERMGLTWYDPLGRHKWRSHLWTHREYILKYIRWEPFMP